MFLCHPALHGTRSRAHASAWRRLVGYFSGYFEPFLRLFRSEIFTTSSFPARIIPTDFSAFGSVWVRRKSHRILHRKKFEYAENPDEIEDFSRIWSSVGIRTRGLLVPKVGRIFWRTFQAFRTAPLGIFLQRCLFQYGSFHLFSAFGSLVWVRTENQRRETAPL